MSMSYWGIVGYGVCIDDIYKYIDQKKVNQLVRDMLPYDIEEDVFEDDTFYGNPYANFGDFLCSLDEDHIFDYDDNGNGSAYFLYMPTYSWRLKGNEPKTQKECKDKMMKILRQVCPGHDDEVMNCIDYISTWGGA